MSAHDTPEVGSGETVGEWEIKQAIRTLLPGLRVGNYVERWSPQSPAVAALKILCEYVSEPIEPAGDEIDAHIPSAHHRRPAGDPAPPDPVQPADAGEGLNLVDALTKVMHQELPTVLSHIGAYRLATAVLAAGFRPGSTYDDLREAGWLTPADLAAREAAWAEKYAAVVGERDRLQRWKDEALPVIFGLQELGKALGLRLGTSITGPDAVEAARNLLARAESAEAALATALREKAEDRALRDRVEALADEWSMTPWDSTPHLGCLDMYRHCANDLRAALAIPTATGDESWRA